MNNLTKYLVLAVAVLISINCRSQSIPETILRVQRVEVVDSNLREVLHTVAHHAGECSLIDKIPCYTIVLSSKGNNGIDYLDFIILPYNEDELRCYAELFGYSNWKIVDTSGMLFLFVYEDTNNFITIGYDTLTLHADVGIEYLYFDLKFMDALPIFKVESYTKKDLVCIKEMSCIDISAMRPFHWGKNTIVYVPEGQENAFYKALIDRGEMGMGLCTSAF